MKIAAIIILCVCGAILLLMAIYLLCGVITFKLALSRKSTVKRIVNKTMAKTIANYKIDFCWWEKFDFERLEIKNKEGLKLVGHFLKNPSDKLAIIVHGYGADYREMQQYAKFFVEKNYNILCVENRAHGESEGKFISMGWLDRLDLVEWINAMLERNQNYKIVLMGLSMGASTVCMASGEKLPTNVKGVISDCGYANAYEEFKYVFKKRAHVPSWPLLNILNTYAKQMYGFDLKQADAVKQIKKSNLPFLFIHGDKDNFVPYSNLKLLSDAVPEERKMVFTSQGSDHAMSYPTSGLDYEKAMSRFLTKFIK